MTYTVKDIPFGPTQASISVTDPVPDAANTPVWAGGELGVSDGVAPGSSPTPTVVGGYRSLQATWTAVTNVDPVYYDVYLSATTGFTPGVTADALVPVMTTSGTGVNLAHRTSGALLGIGTTYYVKLIARDVDGSAAAGSQGSAATVNSDGAAPASSPTPTVTGGFRSLRANWTAISNSDPVFYDVYVSATTGFTPGVTADALTPVVSTSANSVTLDHLASNALLAIGTTYYVKLISRDVDGSASAGSQGSASTLNSDGAAPSSSPAPTVVGTWRSLGITWTAISNNDPVFYDVYVSASNGFTPGGGNFVGTTQGTTFHATTLNGGTLLGVGTTYYVKIIARDADGSASASSQGSAATANSDGTAPSSSPAVDGVSGGPGWLIANWTPITNTDPVTYEVHVSDTTGFTPSGATLYEETGGSTSFIKNLADGTAFDYGTPDASGIGSIPYYVKIIAKDHDGSAAAGAQGSSPLKQVNTVDLTVNSITADLLVATDVVAAMVTAITTESAVFRTAETGQRVEIDVDGVRLIDPSDNVLVNLPTADDAQPTFSGNVITGGLQVTGNAIIQGADNTLDQGAVLTLTSKQGDPNVAPSITGSYPNVALSTSFDSGTCLRIMVTGYDPNGDFGSHPTILGMVEMVNISGKFSTYAVEWNAATGAVDRSHSFQIAASLRRVPGGMVRVTSGDLYCLYFQESSGTFKCAVLDPTTFTVLATVDFGANTSTLDPDGNFNFALGGDGSNPWVFSYNSATSFANRRMITVTSPTVPTLGAATDFSSSGVKFNNAGHPNNPGTSARPTFVTGAAWDGTNWFLQYTYDQTGSSNDGTFFQMFVQSSGALVAKSEIFMKNVTYRYGSGFFYDGTNFRTVMGDSTHIDCKTFTALTWDYTVGTTLYAAFQWEDASHHTKASPIGSFAADSGITAAPLQRQRVSISVPALPGSITKSTMYVLPGSSTPAKTSLKLQAATTYVDTDTATPIIFKQYNGSGTANGDTNNFAGSTASSITAAGTAATAPWVLDGDGLMRLPSINASQKASFVTAADVAYDADSHVLEFYSTFGTGQWAPIASRLANARRSFDMFTDFIGGITAMGEFNNFSNNGGTVTDDPGEVRHPGLIHLSTGTTSNATGNAGVRGGISGANAPILLGSGPVRYAALIRLNTQTTPFAYTVAGLTDTNGASTPSVGFHFRYNGNVNGAKFQRAIGSTYVDTGIAGTNGVWYQLEIIVAADGASAEFFINGVSGGTSSGSAQTGAPVLPVVAISKDTSTTTARAVIVDYCGAAGEFTASRTT